MALVEGCRHSLQVTIPVDEVQSETERVVTEFQRKAKLPGFRPGKVPANLIRKQFHGDIRQQVLENLVPKFLQRRVEQEDLKLVGTPDVRNVKFDEGEPIQFDAEFEVAPEFELGDYVGVEVPYDDPVITDHDIEHELEHIQERKADYVNVDPRPLEDGDVAVISLASVAGVDKPVKQDDMMLELGKGETLPAFTENLRGMSPGESKTFEVSYPEDYGNASLAGKTITFEAEVKAVRRKELPELNDELAKDLGDFQTLDELKEQIRKELHGSRQYRAQQDAKNAIVEKLVDAHEFPVPEAYIERQTRNRLEQMFRSMAGEGVDLTKLNLDVKKLAAAQRDPAIREVRASLILGKVADREAIEPMQDEVDREIERIARQTREPVAAVRMKLQKDGSIGRIAAEIQTQKVLNYLFDHARKIAKE